MAYIIAYRKVTDDWTTYTLALPDSSQPDSVGGADLRCTELATIDGVTYVAVPDGVELPPQPEQIAGSVERVTVSNELREQIKAASLHCAFIAEQVQQEIRKKYSPEDEMYFARIGVGAALGEYAPELGEMQRLREYGRYVEECRQWGRIERAKLGL